MRLQDSSKEIVLIPINDLLDLLPNRMFPILYSTTYLNKFLSHVIRFEHPLSKYHFPFFSADFLSNKEIIFS